MFGESPFRLLVSLRGPVCVCMDVSFKILVISLRAESGVIFLGDPSCLSGALCWLVATNNLSLASVAKSPHTSLHLACLMSVVMASFLLSQKVFPCQLS